MPAVQKNYLKAFTLIEVMVVVAIIGIMTTLVVTSFGNGRIVKELETNAREFASVVREAQNYALAGKQAITDTDPCRFQVSWGGTNYTLTYWHKNVTTGNCTETSLMAMYTLKNGVAFLSADSVYFTLPYANTEFGPGSKAALFSKQSTGHAACIYADGRISDQPGATCP